MRARSSVFPAAAAAVLAGAMGTIALAGDGKQIALKGSDTMSQLGQAWAEAFAKIYPESPVTVTGGGSGTGIAALENGSCDVAQASRNVKPREREKIERATGKKLQEIPVAIDAIVVAVHPSNKVASLTFEQLSQIFQGKVRNWKEVGGDDREIVVLSRDKNSGTHVFFLEHVLRGGNEKGPEQYGSDDLMLASSQAIVDQVAENEGAIGYYGLGWLGPKNRALPVAKMAGDKPVTPSFESALDGSYPISRFLYFYVPGEPTGAVKQFVDFVLSDEGQRIVKKLDFVTLKKV